MGVGKTTIGKELAHRLHLKFIDIDDEIEKIEGKISDIFKSKNESYFRQLESQYIATHDFSSAVVSCGGGLPCYNDNILFLKKNGTVIWLDSDIEWIEQRITPQSRPLWQQKSIAEIKRLKLRRELYYRMADIKLINNHSLDNILSELMEKI